jgi:large subunit ribosomal protein L18
MATGPTYRVQFRRRREGKTNYRYRKSLLVSGSPRAVVRKSLKSIQVQFIIFDVRGDKILTSATAFELKKFGWTGVCSNTSAAYLVGLLAGKRALKKGVTNAVLDIGLHSPTKGSKVFAALKGIVDAGVHVPHDPKVLPSDERIMSSDTGQVKNRIVADEVSENGAE